jgi:DNA-binding MarR family transcriptional regulator
MHQACSLPLAVLMPGSLQIKFLTRTVQTCIVQPVNDITASTPEPLWKLILHASQRVESAFESELAPIGLSLSKLNVLAILLEAGEPLPLSRLAAKLACVKSNVTQLVDRLETEGLVARVDDPNDRRSVLASITDLGRERSMAGTQVMQTVDATLFDGLGTDERQTMERFLAALSAGPCSS